MQILFAVSKIMQMQCLVDLRIVLIFVHVDLKILLAIPIGYKILLTITITIVGGQKIVHNPVCLVASQNEQMAVGRVVVIVAKQGAPWATKDALLLAK